MKKLIFIILLFTAILSAQDEIVVNTYADSTQSEPAIERIDTDENIAVVWRSENQVAPESEGDIFIRFFDSSLNPSGAEFLVNEISEGPQIYPGIAGNNNGAFVVTWASFDRADPSTFYEIKAKLFSDFTASTFEFTVNSTSEHSQTRPQAAMNDEGEFIIVWESWFQDGSDRGIYAQLFDASGDKIGDEFRVNTQVEYSQCRPAVKFLNSGGFIITWESWNESELEYDIFAKIFDESGNVRKEEFRINSYTENYQWFSDILVNNDDSFDIVWCSWEQDGYDGGIYLRSFNQDFVPINEEQQINSSTDYYQWLPKIDEIDKDKKSVMWSSWNLDGSREGVYFKSLTRSNEDYSLETRLNGITESYQWEPDFVSLSGSEIIAVWSSWGNLEKDYEIMMRKIRPDFLIGMIDAETYRHVSGVSTSNFIVHVVDSTILSGHEYEITFGEFENDFLAFSIEDKNISEYKVTNFPLDRGANVQYLTEHFDGIMVEIIPNFYLDIDLDNSGFINNSGTNISFSIEKPVINPVIAPLDVAVIWGNTDTLSDGSFAEPLDTALSPSAVPEILVPFYAETVHEKEKLGIVVFENIETENKRWDPGEKAVFLTPDKFKENDFSTHAQLTSFTDSQNIIWPDKGDTNFIATIKPITSNDIYSFTVSKNDLILDLEEGIIPARISLSQNYPNPFNPATKIQYSIPAVFPSSSTKLTQSKAEGQKITLKIYDILGREVATLVNEHQKPGMYEVIFDASNYSTGIYLYKLSYGDHRQVKKMLLLK